MKTKNRNSASVIILMVITLFTGSMLYSQPGQGQRGGQQGPPPIPDTEQIKEMVSILARDISLTDEQEDSVQKIYIKHFEEVKAKTSGSSRPNREEMESIEANFEKQVKAILTADQQTKFITYKKKHDPGRGVQQRQ